jgi:hypothetical protein
MPKRPQKLYQKTTSNHKLSKATGYRFNIQTSVAFLYANNKQRVFTIPSKTIKYLRINVTKETKDLFSEYYKPLKR